jgi:membrane protease YdiL (CAAX protease family)
LVLLARQRGLALGLAVVVASMLVLFTVPQSYFVAATFASTVCMLVAALAVGGFRPSRRIEFASMAVGLGSAALLYLIFYAGGWAVAAFHPLGITSASETSIYSLISSPSNPLYLQGGVLLFDSAGYESFFRGVLQNRLRPRIGVLSAPAVAVFDAALHIATLNPLWVGATFVTDLVWGLTYHYGRGTQASFTSHLVWDVAIFIIRPIG